MIAGLTKRLWSMEDLLLRPATTSVYKRAALSYMPSGRECNASPFDLELLGMYVG